MKFQSPGEHEDRPEQPAGAGPAGNTTEEPPPAQQFVNAGKGDRRLFTLGWVTVAFLCGYFSYTWQGEEIIHLYQGLFIFVLSTVPALQWAHRGETSFPLMEAFMLTTLNTYAIPLLTGHQSLQLYSAGVITTAAGVVLVFQAAAILTYNITTGLPKHSKFWTEEVILEDFGRFITYSLSATTLYTLASSFYHDQLFGNLPRETEGILRAVFFGLGIICAFITCRRWGLGQLRRNEKIFFGTNLTLQFFFLCASLYLIAGISNVVLALLGYITGSRRVPLLPLVVFIPLLAILHNGKSAMREIYWSTNNPREVALADLPSFYADWIGYGLQTGGDQKHSSTSKLLERASLLHIVCLVVDSTPSRQDYLYGETYRHIPGQFVPRFFWPDKPVGHISTYRLSMYYGLQTEDDIKTTTIAFGMLSEAYANFGFLGAALLGVFFGFTFKKVTVWARFSPMLSYGGLILVILMAWSFQSELTLSIWLSSLYQACVAVLGVPFLVRSFLT